MLDDKYGIYALRLFHYDTRADLTKDINKIGPESIEFDR